MNKSISVVLPVYNEEEILERSVKTLVDFASARFDSRWELVIADNFSTDRTSEIGRDLEKRYDRVRYVRIDQKGVGAALKGAWGASSSDILSYIDADLPFPLETLCELCGEVEKGYDIAIGSRYVRGGNYEINLPRKILSRIFRCWIRVLFSVNFHDSCGIRAMKRDVCHRLLPQLQNDDWFFGDELLIRAARSGYMIKEVPVSAFYDQSRKSKVRIMKTIVNYIKVSILFRCRLMKT